MTPAESVPEAPTGSVDVLVVGGRIAGALTALRLVAGGASVRLLDPHDPPADTVSTHFFRGDGLVRALNETGVLDEVLSTGAPPLACEYFSVDGAPFEQGPPQEPGRIGYCLSVRRSTLDPILFRHAVRAGVDVRPGSKVVDLLRDGDRVVGAVDAAGERHLASVVVGADGRRSVVARLARADTQERHPAARAMYYRYVSGWRTPDQVGPEFLLDGGTFSYAFPSDGATTCLAVSVVVEEHGGTRAQAADRLEHALRSNPRTADRLDASEPVSGTYQGVPADSVWRQGCGLGWALVGDAGTAQDPWSGVGMDSASRQAEAFAGCFLAEPGDWTAAYESRRREQTYDDFAETSRVAPDLRQMLG